MNGIDWSLKSKIDAAVKMITDLQTSVLSTEKQISDLKAENERLSQEQGHPDSPVSWKIIMDRNDEP